MKSILISVLIMFAILFTLPVQAQDNPCDSDEMEVISLFVETFSQQAASIIVAYDADAISDDAHEPVMWGSILILSVSSSVRETVDCNTVNTVLNDFERFASLSLTISVLATQDDTFGVANEIFGTEYGDALIAQWAKARMQMRAYTNN